MSSSRLKRAKQQTNGTPTDKMVQPHMALGLEDSSDEEMRDFDGAGGTKSQESRVSIDELIELVGGFGSFQRRLIFLMGMIWVVIGTMVDLMLFVKKPILEEEVNGVDVCSLDPSEWTWKTETDAIEGINQEWNLACDDANLLGNIGTVYFMGWGIGVAVLGSRSDKSGRRPIIFLGAVLTIFFTFISSFAADWKSYAAVQFFLGGALGGWGLVVYVLAIEFLGAEMRGLIGVGFNGFFSVGIMLCSLLSMSFPHWRSLVRASSILAIFVILPCFSTKLVPESPRWLVCQHKQEEALSTLRKVSEKNGTFVDNNTRLKESGSAVAPNVGVRDLFRYRGVAINTIIMLYAWFTASFAYYGLNLNVSNLSEDLYFNNFVSGLVELPSYIIVHYMLSRIGRRVATSASALFGGACCIMVMFTAEETTDDSEEGGGTSMRMILAMLGKLWISALFAAVYVFASEIFPTVVRTAALGTCSLAARVGGMLAPQAVNLGSIHKSLPMLVFGIAAVVCGFATLMLPETLGKPLPESLEEEVVLVPDEPADDVMGGVSVRGNEQAVKRSRGSKYNIAGLDDDEDGDEL